MFLGLPMAMPLSAKIATISLGVRFGLAWRSLRISSDLFTLSSCSAMSLLLDDRSLFEESPPCELNSRQLKPIVVPDRLQTLIQGATIKEPHPFVIVSQVGEIETLIADMLHSSKFPLKCRRNGRATRAGESGDEEQLASEPFDAHVDYVVEPGLLRLRFDVPGLEDGFNQFRSLLFHLGL